MGRLLLVLSLMAVQGPLRPAEIDVPGLGMKLKAGWRVLLEHGCRYSVPVSWIVTSDGTTAAGSDGSTLRVVTIFRPTPPDYRAEFKRSLSRGAVVREDDAVRFWVEVADEVWHEHRVVAASYTLTCVATLDIRQRPDADETARTIAQSVAPAPEQWPHAR